MPKRYVDLHGSHFAEAHKEVLQGIYAAYTQKEEYLYVITGRGSHPNKGGSRGVLLNAFPAWVKNEPFAHMVKSATLDKNGGMYKVMLHHFQPEHKEKKRVEKPRVKAKVKPEETKAQETGNIFYESGRFILNAFSSLFFSTEDKPQPKKKGLKHAA